MSKRESDDRDWSQASDSLFRASRGDHDPTANDRARVRLALARRLARGVPPTTDGGGRAGATKALRGATIGNVAKLSLGVACVAAGVFAFTREDDRRIAGPEANQLAAPAQPTSVSRPAAPLEFATPAPVASPSWHTMDSVSARSASRRARMDTATVSEERQESKQGARSGVPLGAQRSSAMKGARPESDTSARSESPVPTASSRSASTAQNDPVPNEPAPSVTSPDPEHDDRLDDARAELALVKRIHLAMRNGNPGDALALCAEHERRWPHGTFALERDGVRAIASCESGSSEAGRRARAFLAKYPHATLAPRVTAACASQLTLPARDSNASGVD